MKAVYFIISTILFCVMLVIFPLYRIGLILNKKLSYRIGRRIDDIFNYFNDKW